MGKQPAINDGQLIMVIQSQIDGQRKQLDTNQMLLNEIRGIREEIKVTRDEAKKEYNVMAQMVQEVRDSVTLIYAEEKALQSNVFTKSIKLAKDRYKEEDESFNSIVGKYRRSIWSKLKQEYNVPRYNCIRRLDFNSAVRFVQDFQPEAYL